MILLCSGLSYERSAIQRWLASKRTDPLTNKRLCTTRLVPNHALRNVSAPQDTVIVCHAGADEATLPRPLKIMETSLQNARSLIDVLANRTEA